jgi:predicted RNase H-like HicB family nuclease
MEKTINQAERMAEMEELTVLVCVHDGSWFAQCVEYDLAAQGKTLDDVLYAFEHALNVQIAIDVEHGREPLVDLPPAPERFRTMANKSPSIDAKMPRFQAPQGTSHRMPSFRSRKNLRLCPA